MSHESWFESLRMINQREHYSWLANLPIEVKSIANFGCWSGSEPFALLWTLDAREIVVIELEEKNINCLNEQLEILRKLHPESMQGREFQTLVRDMTKPIPELDDQRYDLAYCEDVLYSLAIQGSVEAVERGIHQMTRVVKPGGLVVAVEPKFGVVFEPRRADISGIDISVRVPVSDPIDMSGFFSIEGFTKVVILDSPAYTYSYQRRQQ